MKTPFLLSLVTTLLLLIAPRLANATNASEPPDFPNSAAAVDAAHTYTLTVGSNTFQGTSPGPSSDADYFKVVVPAGMRVTQIALSTTPSGNTGSFISLTAPLNAGTYTAGFDPGQHLNNISWTIVFTVGPVPDYDVVNSGGVMTVTNNSNNADNLAVSEQVVGGVTDISFSAPGRTFAVNGGSNNNGGTLVPLTNVNSITINGGSGGETFNIGGFTGSSFPSLTINGGAGNDTVNFTGNIAFALDRSLSVNGGAGGADTVNVNNGAQLIASDSGAITIKCSKNVALSGGAVLQTADGDIDVEANQQTPATLGSFNGVNLDGAGTMIKTTGVGFVTVKGVGGKDGGGFQLGVNVTNGAQIDGGADGVMNVMGVGGASTGLANRGVTVYGQGSAINGSSVVVTGTAGASGSAFGIGVSVLYGGVISSGGGGTGVTGTGAGAAGSTSNDGVEIAEVGSSNSIGSLITSNSAVSIIGTGGTAGGASGFGLHVYHSAAVTCPANGNQIEINVDSLSLDSTASISTTGSASFVAFHPFAPATQLNIGGDNAPGVLGFTNAEVARISTALLIFGADAGGANDLTFGASVTPPAGTNVQLSSEGAIHANASGIDLSLGARTLTLFGGTLACPITGPTADSGYPQLNVAGSVNLSGVALNLTSPNYAGTLGDQFTIVKNSGSGTTTTGTFTGLAEGAYLVWPGSNTQVAAQITYLGGASGHDVVLTLVPVAQALTVKNTASDTSVGSLQTVIAFAAAHPGADTITFGPALNGQTITLTGPTNGYAVTISDTSPVTIDASNLSAGLTIQGAAPSGNFGLFHVSNNTLTLRALTLANGGGSAFAAAGRFGGAINNQGTTTLIGCTLAGNSARAGGAIESGGTLTLTQCTLSGNSATNSGGAIENGGTLTVTQCTLSANHASGQGAIYGPAGGSSLTLTNSIVAGNTGGVGFGEDIAYLGGPNDTLTVSGTNIVQSLSASTATRSGTGTIINAPPLLVPTLSYYGGPTQTLPPLPGSPAIDHGDNSQIPNDPATGLPFTTDQRGFARISNGTVDIGAVETSASTVLTAADDDSAGSLRQRVLQATDVTTTITFDPSLVGPIQLASGRILLARNFTIDGGASSSGMTISGNNSSRIFFVNPGQTVVLSNLTLTNGNGVGTQSSGSGGAILNDGATLTLNQCTLTNNSTSGSSGVGGAIFNSGGAGSLTLNRCTVANNAANSPGAKTGGVGCGLIPTTVNQCTFSGNSTVGTGGALGVGQSGFVSSLAVIQSTIAGNQAASGGGININGGTVTLTNSIVASNAGTAADINNNGGTVTRTGRNVIGDNNTVTAQFPAGNPNGNGDYVGTTASPVNPLLAPLGSYGGRTQTMALLMGTPAHNAAVNSSFTSDQRGFAITDGHPDIGAYEAGDISNYFAWIYENLPASTANDANAHTTTTDYDGDGVSNFNEWIAQTNPGDPTSYLHITQMTHSGNMVSITFSSVLGRHYTVEESPDLAVWSFLEGGIPGQVGTITKTYTFAGSLPPKYFFHVLAGP